MSEKEEETPAEKKMKLSDNVPETDPIRCQHFVQRKKRLCKMTVGKKIFGKS